MEITIGAVERLYQRIYHNIYIYIQSVHTFLKSGLLDDIKYDSVKIE